MGGWGGGRGVSSAARNIQPAAASRMATYSHLRVPIMRHVTDQAHPPTQISTDIRIGRAEHLTSRADGGVGESGINARYRRRPAIARLPRSARCATRGGRADFSRLWGRRGPLGYIVTRDRPVGFACKMVVWAPGGYRWLLIHMGGACRAALPAVCSLMCPQRFCVRYQMEHSSRRKLRLPH